MAPKIRSSKGKPDSTKPIENGQTKDTTLFPQWPAFHGLPPAQDLSLVEVLPDQIYTISSLWSSKLCQTYVSFLSTLPLVTTPGKPKKGEAVRVNDRFQIDDPAFAEKLWSGTALEAVVRQSWIGGGELTDDGKRALWGGEVLGLNSNIRIYRYSKGQFFDQHSRPHSLIYPDMPRRLTLQYAVDESNAITFPSSGASNAIPARTTWTLLLYLTSPATGCQGGETVFYPEAPNKRSAPPAPIVTDLEVGMALLHRHGHECLLHEGREVTAGEKWVVRSDICVKR